MKVCLKPLCSNFSNIISTDVTQHALGRSCNVFFQTLDSLSATCGISVLIFNPHKQCSSRPVLTRGWEIENINANKIFSSVITMRELCFNLLCLSRIVVQFTVFNLHYDIPSQRTY